MKACVRAVFDDPGLRFVFSTRSKVPNLLKEDGSRFYGDGYTFTPGKDDVVRKAGETGGYVVSFGSAAHRALAAVDTLRKAGVDIGMINKATLSGFDDAVMDTLVKSSFVLIAEEFNRKTGLGVRMGAELLRRGFRGRFEYLGVTKEGSGGLFEQMAHQGLDPDGIRAAATRLAR
jgi:transketolase C-terminal domain/subunit